MFTGIVIGAVGGLIVGWNFLPQPVFVKQWIDKLRNLGVNN